MLKQLAPVLLLYAACSATALAADCHSGHQTQTDLNICAGDSFEAADAAMNARYAKITACLKEAAKPLVEAQQAWIKVRDAECRFRAGRREDGGSAWPMAMGACLQAMTEERSKQLGYYLTCEEGDLTCPTFSCGFHKVGQAPR